MTIRAWWESLQDRERQMVAIASAVVGVLLIYALIWSPLSDAVADRKTQVDSQHQLLIYLQHASAKIARLKASGISVDATVDNTGLLALVEQTLGSQQLNSYLKQVQQPQKNQIALTFEKVPFDKLMQWLQTLSTTHGIRVQNLSANRLAVVGTADVKMVLVVH
jgi:general secretion pathway protein M